MSSKKKLKPKIEQLKLVITKNTIDLVSTNTNTNNNKHNENISDYNDVDSAVRNIMDNQSYHSDDDNGYSSSKESKMGDSPYNSDDDIDENQAEMKKKYIKHMDDIVDKIKNMNWGDDLVLDSDPNNLSTRKKYCLVKKIIKYNSYVFNGHGSKNILRYFINKTKNDDGHKYQKIVQILDEKSFRRFIPIKSWTDFWNSYKSEPIKSRYLFELIRSDQPCKPYLDIEWKLELSDEKNQKIDARKMDHTEFITKLKKDLTYIFKTRYKIKLNDDSILIASSHSKEKVSFHVIIDHHIKGKSIVYRTNRKGYPESAWDLWMAMIEYDKSYDNIIDKNVYTTDREFRAIFSNKTNDFRPMIPLTYQLKVTTKSKIKMTPDECLRYMVTDTTQDCFYISTPEIPNQYLVINKKYCSDGMYIPKTYTDKKINQLIGLARKVHPTAEYTGRSSCGTGWRFSYEDKNELCYSGNKHDSNGFYIFEDTNRGIIYMKCMSSNCKGIEVLERNNSKKNSIEPTKLKKLF